MRPNMAGHKGLTLIEAVISLMIMAMAAVAIASVLVTTSVAYKKAELKQTSLLMIKTVSEKLRDFVTDDNATLPTAPSLATGEYRGLCDDPNPPLAEGEHDMSCYFNMPSGENGLTLNDVFPGGSAKQFTYTVTNVTCCDTCDASLACKKVDFTINYTTG